MTVKGSRLQFQGSAYHDKVGRLIAFFFFLSKKPGSTFRPLTVSRTGQIGPLLTLLQAGTGATARLAHIPWCGSVIWHPTTPMGKNT